MSDWDKIKLIKQVFKDADTQNSLNSSEKLRGFNASCEQDRLIIQTITNIINK